MGSAFEQRNNSWLSSLAAGASAEELERIRVDLLLASPPARRDAIDADAALAHDIHNRLIERRQTARELVVLNDLARRLTGLHDTADVLQEVAAQSRQLLHMDVAFIMLRTNGATLRIEYIDGSLGSALSGTVLEDGEGVGGEVVKTGRPFWTENYLDDSRLTRVASVDTAAASEQLGGILGVPLRFGSETLGVLLAADRRPHRFSQREIELLAGLASHAAVALQSASLFEATRSSVRQLQETVQLLRRTNDERQGETDLREVLSDLILRGESIDDLAAAIAQSVGSVVTVLGLDGHMFEGVSSAPAPISAVPDSSWFLDANTSVRKIDHPDSSTYVVATVIALHDGVVGYLVTSDDGQEPPVDRIRRLEIGAASVALVIASRRAVTEAELRNRSELLSALLSSDIDDVSAQRRARTAGVDLDRVRSVVVLDPDGRDEKPVNSLASRLATALSGWSAEHAGRAVVLLQESNLMTVRHGITGSTTEPLPAAIGIAACGGGPAEVKGSYESARHTATLLLALSRRDSCALSSDMGMYNGVFSRAGRTDLSAFVDSQLGALLQHDQKYGRQLTATVEAYLAHAQHHSRTAAALFVHNNTLYNQLDRIAELLGDDWRGTDRAFDIQLALRLRALLRTIDQVDEGIDT
ncbi:helix-turn-helix domain-containing protein [Rhodococcoides fascians]|uniref:helix-turn-helix domain-containing protein n=1 Tax=Rhodococcoides fascians TaxID=1828 RepID=UPI001E5F9957|nr:GAF domain-containing protein [Rhodococcus fascians]